jgi:molybdopterin synthase catalytic subunit
VTREPLAVAEATAWAPTPDCGAVVTFCGVVRDHSEGRPGVERLEYEAYESQVVPRLRDVAEEARARWPVLGRLALIHRVGPLDVGEVSVVVVAATPHRAEAFEAAHYCIDRVKATAPIWKLETWRGGTEWSRCDHVADAGHRSTGVHAAAGAEPAPGSGLGVPR